MNSDKDMQYLVMDDTDGTCFPSEKETPPDVQAEIDEIFKKYMLPQKQNHMKSATK